MNLIGSEVRLIIKNLLDQVYDFWASYEQEKLS